MRRDISSFFPLSSWRIYLLPIASSIEAIAARFTICCRLTRKNKWRGKRSSTAWFEDGACDGLNLMAPLLPGGLEDFARHVVPVLQRRGLFRTAYAGTTLRSHLGLAD